MWPEIGLCLGTVRQASLVQLIEVAGQNRFSTITASPEMVERALDSGTTASELKQRLADRGLRISYLDALTREVPGAAAIEAVPQLWRRNWTYGLDDLLRMADALDVPTINVTHFLGTPVPAAAMAQGIAALAARVAAHGKTLALEFMPDTSLPDADVAARIVQLTGAGNVGLMVDTWHLLRGGGSAADIRALPPGALRGVQLNDRLADASQPFDTGYRVSERSLPGDGNAPLREIVLAIVANTPSVTIEVEVFNSALAGMSAAQAAEAVATALRRWRASLGPIMA